MDMTTLRRRLVALGYQPSAEGAPFGAADRAAILSALTDGPDYKLGADDIEDAADQLRVDPAAIWAVWDVEASGAAFTDGRPTILFEPHRFSRATGHRYDASHPAISSRNWNRKLYPARQVGRWGQLLDAVALDVDAGFASASYGGFQILGENHAICGAVTPWAFAWQQSQTEADQLAAFLRFVEGKGLAAALRRHDWAAFAKGYNGTAFRENRYDERLAAAYARRRAARAA
ncbi:N-acetylmuramidase family protein [Sphingomonas sp. HT-1]|uniref:N-acetylmuramidase family protein n=1 Tax=unclassified Sphingomonas TaxID=196159 RepID=UPI0002EF7DE4|nr:MULTISPECIES: N-acetylmuramidase family protein [unclassified Sphingomonas]KTF70685.1 peptidoglycan-binding protein [Sphingomonas sp. WG]